MFIILITFYSVFMLSIILDSSLFSCVISVCACSYTTHNVSYADWHSLLVMYPLLHFLIIIGLWCQTFVRVSLTNNSRRQGFHHSFMHYYSIGSLVYQTAVLLISLLHYNSPFVEGVSSANAELLYNCGMLASAL